MNPAQEFPFVIRYSGLDERHLFNISHLTLRSRFKVIWRLLMTGHSHLYDCKLSAGDRAAAQRWYEGWYEGKE